jgi:hypothetical protein
MRTGLPAYVAAILLGLEAAGSAFGWGCFVPVVPVPLPLRFQEQVITTYRAEYRTEFREV